MASTTTDRLNGVTASLASKAPVRAASTADITLSGAQTIDSVAVVADDRVLVKDQTDGIENGIYIAATGAWVRAPDFDGARDVVTGTFVVVAEGTAGAGTLWRVSTTGDITIGTTSIAFAIMTVDSASAFMVTVLDDETAGDARTTLGAIGNLSEDTTPQLGGDLDLNGNGIDFPTTPNITDVLDEDNMSSDSATMLATQQSIKAYVDSAAVLPRSYLSGLGLSNGTDTAHDIDIAVGAARNAADDGNFTLSSSVGKRIDATWATGGTPGTPTGGLSSSLTVSNTTWYAVHLVLIAGTAEVGFDTSIVAANLIADHSATKYRRLGSVLTDGSANILGFTQIGDQFDFDAAVFVGTTLNATAATATNITVTVPPSTLAILNLHAPADAAGPVFYLSPLHADDVAPTPTAAPLGAITATSGTLAFQGNFRIQVDSSSQIRAEANTNSAVIRIAATGWVDRRGRDD